MKIYELETKSGRVSRVAVANNNQESRLHKIIASNKNKGYEAFTRVEVIKNGIHDIKQFEQLVDKLV